MCGKKHHPLCQLTKEVRAGLKAEKKVKNAERQKKKAEARPLSSPYLGFTVSKLADHTFSG